MIVALILFLGLAALNLWLWFQVLRRGVRGAFGKLALQVSALALVYGVLRGYSAALLPVVLAPPLLVLTESNMAQFAGLLWALAPFVVPVGVFVGAAALVMPHLRIWAPALALASGLFAALVAGGPITAQKMCETAALRGAGPIFRHGLFFSLRHAPREFQFDLHAQTEIDGKQWGWSYSALDWYLIPEDAVRNVSKPPTPLICPER